MTMCRVCGTPAPDGAGKCATCGESFAAAGGPSSLAMTLARWAVLAGIVCAAFAGYRRWAAPQASAAAAAPAAAKTVNPLTQLAGSVGN